MAPGHSPAKRPWPNWVLPASALAAWTAFSLWLLPVLSENLEYLTSLEAGDRHGRGAVHALFQPTLLLFKGLLGALGWSGSLLLPIGMLNAFVGAAALWLLWLLTERLSGDSDAALAGTLLVGTTSGFWMGCLRVDPYALAALFAVLTLYAAALRPVPSKVLPALLGATAALSICYHAASIALVPMVAAAVWLDGKDLASRTAAGARAAGALILSAGAGYLAWSRFPRPEPGAGLFSPGLLRVVESVPGTSMYDGSGLWRQFRMLSASLGFHGDTFLKVAVLAAALGLPGLARLWRERRRDLLVPLSGAAAYYGFYLINNTQNGFIFIILAFLLPVACLLACSRTWARRVFIAAAWIGVLVSVARLRNSFLVRPNSMFLAEARFLAERTDPRTLLLTPGCPFDELFHFGQLYAVEVGESPTLGQSCAAPFSPPGRELERRVRWHLRHGRDVVWVRGGYAPESERAEMGQQKFWQLAYEGSGSRGQAQARAAAVEDFLGRRFAWATDLVSPSGRVYRRLALKPGDKLPAAEPPKRRAGDLLAAAQPVPPMLRWQQRHLEAVLGRDPGDPYAYGDLLDFYDGILLERGIVTDPKRALVRLRELLDRGDAPVTAFRCLQLARSAARQGERALALKGLARAEAAGPDMPTRREIARAYLEAGEPGKALPMLEACARGVSADTDAQLRLAQAALKAGRKDLALDALSKAGRLSPEPAPEAKGAGTARQGVQRQVQQVIQPVVPARPDPTAKRELARAFLDAGRPDKALPLLQACAEGPSAGVEERLLLAQAALKAGRKDLALGAIEKALRQKPEPAQPSMAFQFLSMARGASQQGRRDLALQLIQRAEAAQPDPALRREVVRAYLEAGEPAKALPLLQACAEGPSAGVEDRLLLAQVAQESGRKDLALDAAGKVVRGTQDAAQLHAAALVLQEAGETDKALGVLDGLVARFPDESLYRDSRGVLQARRGKAAEAEEDLRAALRLDPRRPGPYVSLGGLLAGSGRGEEALALYDKALGLAQVRADKDLEALLRRDRERLARPDKAAQP